MAVKISGTRGSGSSARPFPRRGAITELTGRLSSGRTSVLVAWLAAATRAGGTAALVDSDDTFDPTRAASAGVDLSRVLWVRCAGRRDATIRATEVLARCPGFALIALDTGQSPRPLAPTRAFRLKLAVRRAGTALVIVGERRIAGAAAELALETMAENLEWTRFAAHATRLAALRTTLHLVRPQAATHPGASSVRWPCALRLLA